MTLEQYNTNLQELAALSTERATENIIVPAASSLLGTIKNRIMREGKKTDGGQIGQYSRKPAYFTQTQFDKKGSFKPRGKTGKTVHKDGESHTSMYIGDGYFGLRGIQGKPNDKINANYTGSTMLSYVMQPEQSFVLLGLDTERAAKIRHGLEARKGKLFSATKEEMNDYNQEVTEESKSLTLKILNA